MRKKRFLFILALLLEQCFVWDPSLADFRHLRALLDPFEVKIWSKMVHF